MELQTAPIVTVIIPSYNHGQWIAKSIESVLSQTYKSIELIIVDDGSTDNSKKIILQYARLSNVTVVFKDENKGQGHSLNLALKLAKGKYISILPSDDWFLPEKTELQVRLLENLPSDFGLVYGRGLRYYESTKELRPVKFQKHRGDVLVELVSKGNFVYPASPLIKKSAFDNISFDETYVAEGEAIFLRIAENFKFDYIDQDVVVMRDHWYNSGSAHELMYREVIRWWADYFLSPNVPVKVAHLRRQVLARHYRMFGLSLMTENSQFRVGRRALIESVKLYPQFLFDIKLVLGFCVSILPQPIASVLVSLKRRKADVHPRS